MMKRVFVLASLLALGGCASAPIQTMMHRPAHHVVPTPAAPSQPPVVAVPAAPVPPGTFKMRWWDHAKSEAGKIRSHLHPHHKEAQ